MSVPKENLNAETQRAQRLGVWVFQVVFENGQTREIRVIACRFTRPWMEAAGQAETLGVVRSITLTNEHPAKK